MCKLVPAISGSPVEFLELREANHFWLNDIQGLAANMDSSKTIADCVDS